MFDVDSCGSASLPRSKRYQLMRVPVAEDVTDPERSDHTGAHVPVAFSLDAKPAREIFYDRLFKIVWAPTNSRCACCGRGRWKCDFESGSA
jgi:hypothetical protein